MLDKLYNLRRDRGSGWEKPYKPALLLALIDEVEQGDLADNRFTLSDELQQIRAQVREVDRTLAGFDFTFQPSLDRERIMALAGLGDLVLTCTGEASRNRRFGLALGRAAGIEEALEEVGQVVEGYHAAEEVMRAAARAGVEMPISQQVHGILYSGWSAAKGVKVLMEREQKAETE